MNEEAAGKQNITRARMECKTYNFANIWISSLASSLHIFLYSLTSAHRPELCRFNKQQGMNLKMVGCHNHINTTL